MERINKVMLGRFFALAAAVFAITIATFARTLQQDGWSVWQIAAARGLFGAAFIGLISPRRIGQVHGDIKGTAAYASLTALSVILWIFSVMHTPLGIALSLLFLSSIWVVLYERLVEKKKRAKVAAAAAMAFAGTVLITGAYEPRSDYGLWGLIVSFINSAVFAAALISGRKGKAEKEAQTFWTLAILLVVLGWSLPGAAWSVHSAVNAVGIGVISSGLMFLCMTQALKLTSSSEVSVLMYAEVLLGWVIGWAVYQEQAKWPAVVGAVAIILAGLIVALGSAPSSPGRQTAADMSGSGIDNPTES